MSELETQNPTPDHTVTLNEIVSQAAIEWSHEDITAMVAGFRDQRERWNAEQQAGSRKRVPSTKVGVTKAKLDLAFAGLKL